MSTFQGLRLAQQPPQRRDEPQYPPWIDQLPEKDRKRVRQEYDSARNGFTTSDPNQDPKPLKPHLCRARQEGTNEYRRGRREPPRQDEDCYRDVPTS